MLFLTLPQAKWRIAGNSGKPCPLRGTTRIRYQPGAESDAGPKDPTSVLLGARKVTFQVAEEHLEEYCDSKFESTEGKKSCHDVVDFLRQKRAHAEKWCRHELTEEGQPGRYCQSLDDLEKLLWELESTGSARKMYNVLSNQQRLERKSSRMVADEDAIWQRREAVQRTFDQLDADQDGLISNLEFLSGIQKLDEFLGDRDLALMKKCVAIEGGIPRNVFCQVALDEHPAHTLLRHTATKLFKEVDTDGDGQLSTEEFLSAVTSMTEKMSQEDMALLIKCMEIQGHVPLAQFLDIVDDRQPGEVLLRHLARQLFDKVDHNHDDVLDREEFLTAMHAIKEDVTSHELELVFSAMDIHGFVTKEQFLDIVIAERANDPNSDAAMFRSLMHDRPAWWSECPRSVDMS